MEFSNFMKRAYFCQCRRLPICVAAALFVLLVWGGLYLYLHSNFLRSYLSARVSQSLGLDGCFSPLRWAGLAMESDGFKGKGKGPVIDMQAEALHGEVSLSGVLRGVLGLDNVSIDKLDIDFDASRESYGLSRRARDTLHPDVKRNSKSRSSSVLEVGNLRIKDANATVKLAEGVKVGVCGTTIAVKEDEGGYGHHVKIDGGQCFILEGQENSLDILGFDARFCDQVLYVSSMELGIGGTGRLQGNGKWDMRGGGYEIKGEAVRIPLARLVPENWAQRSSGMVSGTIWMEGSPQSAVMSGVLKLEEASMTALPVLDVLSTYTDTRRLRRLKVTKCEAEWAWRSGEGKLSNIVLESEGLIRLEGQLTIVGEELDGSFNLGINPSLLSFVPGAEGGVFVKERGGMLWTEFRISGPLSNPRDDLGVRLLAAASSRVVGNLLHEYDNSEPSLEVFSEEATDEVLGRGLKAMDHGKRTLEEAGDILKNGGLFGEIFGD